MRRFLGCISLIFLAFPSLSISQSSPFDPCPVQCSLAGTNPSNWTHLHGQPALKRCKEPVLFDTAVFTPIESPYTHITLRSCTASELVTTQEIEYNPAPFTFGSPLRRRAEGSPSHGCNRDAEIIHNKTAVNVLRWKDDQEISQSEAKGMLLLAVEKLKSYLSTQEDCHSTIMMARHDLVVIGLYVGTEILKSSAISVVERFIQAAKEEGMPSKLASEVCRNKTPSTWTVGIYADFRGNISAVQESIRSWSEAACLTGYDSKDNKVETEISFVRATSVPIESSLISGLEQINEPVKRSTAIDLIFRAECKYIQAVADDSCWSLSQRCGGIDQKDFESYNGGKDICSTIKPGQWVCCSKGTLPDFSPKPNPDGSCATYIIKPKDTCYDIAMAHSIPTAAKLEELNNKSWGWAGCDYLQLDQKICLSKGDPPMPSPIKNAICGPQVPGTQRPNNKTDIKDLNPCPLNVCCNVWGQCGTTDDFCVKSPADTGAPGTTKPGKNSCISSCGMEITNNDKGPAEFRKIAYFEAWNRKRPCLHMDVTDIDKTKFTHIHFAFPDITRDFNVNITSYKDQFDKLKSMTGIKRIVSLGGWAFSTEAPTYTIFRDGVTEANRATLANNVAAFVNEHGIDGIDFDWEYPAAPDIPGIPAGNIEAGKQYLEFLKLVKRRLPNKQVAIAAPASYWYLKGFPIADMAGVVDYIVYMTYDLHGQWDYGNKWSSAGCDDGNCLRSHINSTETKNTLAMITKAGVPSHKVVVGITSYGRSFHMAKAGCTGPDCKFTGSSTESNAIPGSCTETRGYISNAEIRDILSRGQDPEHSGYTVKSWHDDASDSDIVVYNDLEWVAYMSNSTKDRRSMWYRSQNFGGTSDWAVDLDKDYGGLGIGNDGGDPDADGGPQCDQATKFDTLEKISGDTGLDPYCAEIYALRVLQIMLQQSLVKYTRVNDGYDSKFKSYVNYMKKNLPEVLRRYMDWSNGEGQKYFDCHFVGNGDDWRGPCPVPRSVYGDFLIGIWKIEMTLRDSEGFWKALSDKTGILQDWIEWGTYEQKTICNPSPCLQLELTVTGMPKLKKEYDISNPKDIVTKAIGNVGNLEVELMARMFDVGMALWLGNNGEVVTALSMPVFMVENAVEGMDQAKEIGEDVQEQEAKNTLLTVLSVIFLVVPFLGEAAAVAAGAMNVARIVALAGIAANGGLAIQDIIDNPEMAPLAIMGMLTGGRLRTPKDYSEAVKYRKAMNPTDFATLGERFAKQDSMIQDIVKACKRG